MILCIFFFEVMDTQGIDRIYPDLDVETPYYVVKLSGKLTVKKKKVKTRYEIFKSIAAGCILCSTDSTDCVGK